MFQVFCMFRPCQLVLRSKKLGLQQPSVCVQVTSWVVLGLRPLLDIRLHYLHTLYLIIFNVLFFFLVFVVASYDIGGIDERDHFVRWLQGLIELWSRWRGAKNVTSRDRTLKDLQRDQLRALLSAFTCIVVALTIGVEGVILRFDFFFWRFFIILLLN